MYIYFNMETFYYKLDKGTTLGEKASLLLSQMEQAEIAADRLASKYGAKNYFVDAAQDAGGMVAVEFPKTRIVNKKIWAPTQIADNTSCYVPNVIIREELIESAKANEYKGSNVVVSQQEMNFEQVQFRFSREQAAAMAKVKLTTPSLERLGKKYGIDRRRLNMLSLGVPIDNVLPELPAQDKIMFRLSLTEDKQIQNAMAGRKFKLVHSYEGDKEAIRIYREWMELPVVPSGTVNAILGVECDTHRCGLLDCGKYLYVTSAVKIDNPELTEGSKYEFDIMQKSNREKPN